MVAPDAVPCERTLGPELGAYLRRVHEERDVRFRLGRTVGSIRERSVVLDDGAVLLAELVVVGIGVRPRLALAASAGVADDRGEPFAEVPFFWTRQFDLSVAYVGHASAWDEVVVDGEIAARDCSISDLRGGRTLAVATLGRDRASLAAQLAMRSSVAEPPIPTSTPNTG